MHLAPDFPAGDSVLLFGEVLRIPEHEDSIINLQRWAQFDLHHLDNVCLGQKQEGFAVNLLHVNKQTGIRRKAIEAVYPLVSPGWGAVTEPEASASLQSSVTVQSDGRPHKPQSQPLLIPFPQDSKAKLNAKGVHSVK